MFFQPSRAITRLTATVLLLGYLPGCTTWKVQPGADPESIAAQTPSQARITLAGGSEVTLSHLRMENDSLVGDVFVPGARSNAVQRRAIPPDSVTAIALRQLSAGKTAGLVVGFGVAVALVAVAADGGDGSSGGGGFGGGGGSFSCPLVYSWDGTGWRLDSGTFGGAITPILARTDVDNLDYAMPRAGALRLRLANELNEIDYVDAVSVLAVDHRPGVAVAPSSDGTLHTLGRLESPLAGMDDHGVSVMNRVSRRDGWNWESRLTGRDTSNIAELRDGITLTFAKPLGAAEARLVVDGNSSAWAAYLVQEFIRAHGWNTQAWYDSVNASPQLARRLGSMMAGEGFLEVKIKIDGKWEHQGYIWEAGPEITKRQVLRIDLSRVAGKSVEIRLESAPLFWLIDNVALDYSAQVPLVTRELRARTALDHHGRDVRQPLAQTDRNYLVLQRGDRTDLVFDVPSTPPGQARSYLLRSHGWYRMNTLESERPDVALLDQVMNRDRGASRVAVTRLNQALVRLEKGIE